MANNLYGSRFIEKLVSSGYKNPTYAMAEIIDNSVDANAKNIDIILVEDQKIDGGRNSRYVSDVFFIDDGSGMNYEQINGCLKFSEGEGTSNSRIGTFGVGLPNSSIYVGRRVEVYSKDINTDKWNYVFLDLDDQLVRTEPGYDLSIEKHPNFDNIHLNVNFDEAKTIIRWSKITRLSARKPETIIKKTSTLVGRIYRYVLNEIKITFSSILKGNKEYDIYKEKALPYDPLFVLSERSQITDLVWTLATDKAKNQQNPKIPHNEEFNTQFHYKKFIAGCIPNQTILPLFQKIDEYWDVKQRVSISGREYSYRIKASVANKSIVHPGISSGGGTSLGMEIGNKMTGGNDLNGGNIYFIRTKREITCGSFGLYRTTNEKERFWTIEIEFDSDLDKLMGLDYQKQQVDFRRVNQDEVNEIENALNLEINEQQQILFQDITYNIQSCLKKIKDILKGYYKEFQLNENEAIAIDGGGNVTFIPTVEPAVIQAFPTGPRWSEENKQEMIKFLKGKFMAIKEESIARQVDNFANGLTNTIVLYDNTADGNLFSLNSVRGTRITSINTEHPFYKKVIEKLKENRALGVFTIAIEMIICSFAYEMDSLIRDEEKLELILNRYLRLTSDRLSKFITEGNIEVDTSYWENSLNEDSDF